MIHPLPVLALVLTTSLGWLLMPKLIRLVIQSKIVLEPDITPELFQTWVHPPMEVFLKVYLYNVSNPGEVEGGALPILTEVGPYVFLENKTKYNLKVDEEQDTIEYMEFKSFQFDVERSPGLSLEDELTIINAPFVMAAIKVYHEIPWPASEVGKMILRQKESLEPVFLRKSVAAITLGWKVPLLEKLHEELGITVMPNNTFGYLSTEHNSVKGPFLVSRGIKDSSTFGSILKFENRSELNYWRKGSSCNQILGSDGTLFPPFLDKGRVLHLMNPSVCRSLYMTFERESEVEGIPAYRFSVPPAVLEDARVSEENSCFCTSHDSEPEKCLKRGAVEIGVCLNDAPAAMSMPRFLGAHPDYVGIGGLFPSEKEHATYLDLEPTSGLFLKGSNKVQLNLMLQPVKGIKPLAKLPTTLFPLIWIDSCSTLNPPLIARIKEILLQIWIADLFFRWMLPLLTALIFIGLHLNMELRRRRRRREMVKKGKPKPGRNTCNDFKDYPDVREVEKLTHAAK